MLDSRYLSQCIKEAGQMLIDNCEDLAGKTEGLKDFYIRIDFPEEIGYIPEIDISRTHYISNKAIDRLFDLKDKLEKEK